MAKLKNKLSESYISSQDILKSNQEQSATIKTFENDEKAMKDLKQRIEKSRKEQARSAKIAENIIVN